MTAAIDTTCQLIERPRAATQPRPRAGLLDTPHADAWSDRLAEASVGVATLLALGCLIDTMHVTPDAIAVTLYRAPPVGALGRRCHSVDTCGDQPTARVDWHGVRVAWPVQVAS